MLWTNMLRFLFLLIVVAVIAIAYGLLDRTSDDELDGSEDSQADSDDSEADSTNSQAEIVEYEIRDIQENTDKVALTFDDGPDPEVTPQILEVLDEHEAKATFFMVGNSVDAYPDQARQVAKSGHEIGNHTMTHEDLTLLPDENAIDEIEQTNHLIAETTKQKPTTFRPPYGSIDENLKAALDIPVILWTIDSFDWQSRDAEQINQLIQAEIHDEAIILMHDTYQETADALPDILEYLKTHDYEFVTVSELLHEQDSA